MYKTSAELKREAKESLRGRWKEAVLLNIVPSILQVVSGILMALGMIAIIALTAFLVSTSNSTSSNNFGGDVYDNGFSDDLDDLDDYESYYNGGSASTLDQFLADNDLNYSYNFAPGGFIFSTLISIAVSFVGLGIMFTFIDIQRNPMRKINPGSDAFRLFNGKDFVPIVLIQLITYLFTYLWSLLFVIPGIVKGYGYSQASFIYKDLSEHEDTEKLSAYNYVKESNMLMKGHKGRLFYIDLSFIGWHILCLLTAGIGYLFLNPYMNATKAAFYRNVSQDRYLYIAGEAETIGEEQSDNDEWTNF